MLNPEFFGEYGAHANKELRESVKQKEGVYMVMDRNLKVAKIVSSLTRTMELCGSKERQRIGLGHPGDWTLVTALINAPAIRNDLAWKVTVDNVVRILESPWERDRYDTMRGRDGRMWVAPKKVLMSLETRMFHIEGLRAVQDAIRITADSAALIPVFQKKDGLIWIPFSGEQFEAHDCVEKGLRLRGGRGRMTFYLNGLERFRA